MSDLIERQAALNAINAERVKTDGIHLWRTYRNESCDEFADIIRNLPSVEPEIIHCKECMHNGSFDTDCPIDWAGKNYCSFAERRTDE